MPTIPLSFIVVYNFVEQSLSEFFTILEIQGADKLPMQQASSLSLYMLLPYSLHLPTHPLNLPPLIHYSMLSYSVYFTSPQAYLFSLFGFLHDDQDRAFVSSLSP